MIAAALGLVAACGGPKPALLLAVGPAPVISEGAELLSEIRLDNGASPLPGELELVIDAEAAALFASPGVVRGGAGEPLLSLLPKCSVVRPGEGSALVPMRLEAVDGRYRPLDLIVAIESNATAECAPIMTLWEGDCATPSVSLDALALVPGPPPPVCLRVESRDLEFERLWLRSETDLPASVLSPDDRPAADDFDVFTTPQALEDTSFVRGEFALELEIYGAPPLPGAEPLTDSDVDVVIGARGELAIELAGNAVDVIELGDAVMPAELWYFRDPAEPREPCLRAVPTTLAPPVVAREKSFLSLDGEGDVESATDNVWRCGAGPVDLSISPPAQSAPTETVTLDAALCGAADCGKSRALDVIASRELEVNTTNEVDDFACLADDGAGEPGPPLVACADLIDDGDDTPLIFVKTPSGRSCVYLGEQGRFGPDPADFDMTMPLPLGGGGALDAAPDSVISFSLATVEGPRPIILGSFGAQTLELTATRDPSPVARWVANDLDLPGAPLDLAFALGPDPSIGAEFLVYPILDGNGETNSLQIECLLPGLGVCVDGVLPLGWPTPREVAGTGKADFDGDGDEDVALFSFTGAGVAKRLHIEIFEVNWSDFNPQLVFVHTLVDAGLIGSRISAVAVSGIGVREKLYVSFDPDNPIGLLLVPEAAGEPPVMPVESIYVDDTPGLALGVAAASGELVAGFALGVRRLIESPRVWVHADPILAEEQDETGSIVSPGEGYGEALGNCLTATGNNIVFSSGPDTVRWVANP
jgi:hypothetical protein